MDLLSFLSVFSEYVCLIYILHQDGEGGNFDCKQAVEIARY